MCSSELGLTQPALTRQLQTLEEKLGVKLFLRKATGVELTEDGGWFRDEAKHMLFLYDSLVSKRTLRERHERAELRVSSVPPHFGSVLDLAYWLERFNGTQEGCKASYHTFGSFDGLDKLRAGELDIWITESSFDFEIPPDLENQEFSIDEVTAVVPKDHLLANAELLGLKQLGRYPVVIHHTKGSLSWRTQIEALQYDGLPVPKAILECQSEQTFLNYVKNQMGVGVCIGKRGLEDQDLVTIPLEGLTPDQALRVQFLSRVGDTNAAVARFRNYIATKIGREIL